MFPPLEAARGEAFSNLALGERRGGQACQSECRLGRRKKESEPGSPPRGPLWLSRRRALALWLGVRQQLLRNPTERLPKAWRGTWRGRRVQRCPRCECGVPRAGARKGHPKRRASPSPAGDCFSLSAPLAPGAPQLVAGSGPPVTSERRPSLAVTQRGSQAAEQLLCLASPLASGKMESAGLSSTDQKLIRESWQKVSGSPLEHGIVLFTRLFDLEPELLPLFQYNCKKFSTPEECLSSPEFLEHIRKVMLVIDAAVTHLENLHRLEEYLANLGKKHQAVGVKVESFSTVGESLLYMLEKCHGPAFNLNVREAWTKLYGAVVKAMSCGWDVLRKVE